MRASVRWKARSGIVVAVRNCDSRQCATCCKGIVCACSKQHTQIPIDDVSEFSATANL